ncbi:MAG: hypothetical protein NC203_08990 [Firmicutes bacterium]|nr:hypothetical protein [[Eubacterium] siraeum]MCM1488488.1 hypothetical protein [Bacillota bacterium]
MNRENLLSAFGEIDEEFFSEAPENGENLSPVFVTPQKPKRSKRPFIVAASAAAACGVLILGIGLGSRGGLIPENQITAYNSSEIYPDIIFEERYKEIYNARDLYQIQRTEIDFDAVKKYGIPAVIDGEKWFFAYYEKNQEGERRSSNIILIDNSSKEEKTIYSYATAKNGILPGLELTGVYEDFLYFIRRDYSENGISVLCRLNLSDYTPEEIFSFEGMYANPILSKTEDCLYIQELKQLSEIEFASGTYRIDLSSGEAVYMDGVCSASAYKDGIIYKKSGDISHDSQSDNDIYYHSPRRYDDIVLFSEEYEDLKAIGKEALLYIRTVGGEVLPETEFGVRDESGERTLFTDNGNNVLLSDLTYGCSITENGLAAFITLHGKPLIYDCREDKFSFVDDDTDNYFLILTSSDFNDNGSVSFIEVKRNASNTAEVEFVTVKRKDGDPNKDDNSDKNKDKTLMEIPSADELYNVGKYELYSDKENYRDLELDELREAFAADQFYGGGRVYLYEGNKLFYTTEAVQELEAWELEEMTEEAREKNKNRKTAAAIYYYQTDSKEKTLVTEDIPDNGSNGLLLKIAGIYDNVIYYYKVENSRHWEEQKISLWSYDTDKGEKLKIADLEMNYYQSLSPAVKTKEYIFYADNGAAPVSYGEDNSKIYRYNINTREAEAFKDNAKNPTICPCKNGFIYYSLGQYCRIYDEKGDRDLEIPSLDGKTSAAGDNIFFAQRGEHGEYNTLMEIYDADLTFKKSADLPAFTEYAVNDSFAKEGGKGLAYLDIEFTSRELMEEPESYIRPYSAPASDLRADKNIYEALIYDSEKNIFSVLELKEGQSVAYAAKTDEGLMIFTANEDHSKIEYCIVAKGTNIGAPSDENAVEETP